MVEPYRDLEKILFRGFLEQKAQIEDISFVFKSVNMKEMSEIELRCPMSESKTYNQIFTDYFLTYSIFMINGENLLSGIREDNLSQLLKDIKDWDDVFSKQLMVIINDLNTRVSNAYKIIESYAYEDMSRYYWKALRDKTLNSFDVTGITGSSALALNEHQLLWTFYNLIEDSNQEFERGWGFAKFIASATNQKGIKHIDDRDKTKKRHEQERREEVKQRVKNPKAFEDAAVIRQQARTKEELQKQLLDWVQDRRDIHEEAMEKWEKDVAKKYYEQQEKLNQKPEELPEIKTMDPKDYPRMVPVSMEQIKERLKQRIADRDQILKKIPTPAVLNDQKKPKILDYMTKQNLEAAKTEVQSAQFAPRYQQPTQVPAVPAPGINTAPSANSRLSAMLGVPENAPVQRPVQPSAQAGTKAPPSKLPGIDGKVILDPDEIAKRMKAKGLIPRKK